MYIYDRCRSAHIDISRYKKRKRESSFTWRDASGGSATEVRHVMAGLTLPYIYDTAPVVISDGV